MEIKKALKISGIHDWTGMNIVSKIMSYKEKLKVEKDASKREFFTKKLEELKIEIQDYKNSL